MFGLSNPYFLSYSKKALSIVLNFGFYKFISINFYYIMKLLLDSRGMIYFIVANSVIKALIIIFSFIESGVLDECKSCVINI